jgi:CRP-like cAMP-binding protein
VDPSHLVRVPVFAQLSPTDLALVALRITVERYEAGAVVVRQGDVADKLFIVGDGQLEVLVEGRQGPLRVTVLGAYSYFGEIALLSDPPGRRTATVRALTPVELYSLHKEDFLGLLRSQPSLAEAVSGLARRRGEQLRQLLATTSGIARTIASSPATIAAPIIEPGRADEGRPAPPAMLTMREGAQVGRTDVLDGRVVTLGRAIDCEILLPDNGVSRRQCRIRWADDSYLLEDLDSSNGTYVNGSRITTAQLYNGDLIQVGDTVLEFALT